MAAWMCRSSVMSSSARSLLSRSKTFLPKAPSSSTKSVPSPSTPRPSTSRCVSVLGCVDSLMPLHSAIASARLRSRIALDASCWSMLSQDFAVPR